MLRTASNLAAAHIAPLALVLIACSQLWCAHAHDLSAWKGGGFGMFSTVDSVDARFVRIYLEHGSERSAVELPREPSIRRQAVLLRTHPSQTQLDDLARSLAHQRWVPSDYDPFLPLTAAQRATTGLARWRIQHPNEPSSRANEAFRPHAVTVELWRYRYAPDELRISATLALRGTTRCERGGS